MNIMIANGALSRDIINKLKQFFPEIEFIDQKTEVSAAEVIIARPGFFTIANRSRFPAVKWCQLTFAGYDTVAPVWRDVLFTNARDVFSLPIADDVMAKILYFSRNIDIYRQQMKNKIWQPLYREEELSVKIIGILGTGSLGQEIAKRVQSFGAVVIGYRRHPAPVKYFDQIVTKEAGLKKILAVSDYLVITLPLNKETKHLIGKAEFMKMKKTAVIINVGRGGIIVEADLIAALEKNIIYGAALDVTEIEPLPKESRLWEIDNCLITPHNSNYSPVVKARLIRLLMNNINNYRCNQPLINVINDL